MKKIFLLFILFSCHLFSQELPEGIGPFKFDKLTIRKFDSIAKSQNLKLVECVGQKCLLSNLKSGVYIKVKPNTKDISDNIYNVYYLDNVINYKVRNLKINNKYSVELADLIFVNEKLSFFYFSNPTNYLSTDFETKYGGGELSKTETDDSCYINNERFPYTRKNYYRTYLNGDIKINRIISDDRDENCDQKTTLYYIGENTEVMKKIKDENKEKTEGYEKIETDKKKQELKDL